MKKLYIIAILIIFISGCTAGDYGALYNKEADTIISNSKLLFVSEKGELIIRNPNADPIALSETDAVTLKVIDGVSDVYALSCPSNYSELIFVIKTDGTLWQLMEDVNTDQYRLEKVYGVENCVKVCSGIGYVIALSADGSVYAWGDNTYGQLGNGSNERRVAPEKIQVLADIIDISSGENHCMALSDSGEVYTWGRNNQGQLGDGSYTIYSDYGYGTDVFENHDRSSVYQLESLSDIIQIAAGDEWSVVLRKDGYVFEWGTRASLNVDYCLLSPVKVENLEQIVQISAHDIHALALSSSGEIWRWGNVIFAPSEGMSPPHKTADFPNAIKIVAGDTDTVVTKDKEIWQAFVGDEYYDEKAACVVSHKDIQSLLSTKK